MGETTAINAHHFQGRVLVNQDDESDGLDHKQLYAWQLICLITSFAE